LTKLDNTVISAGRILWTPISGQHVDNIMRENRAPDVAAPSYRGAAAVEPPKRLRAKLTNSPLSVRASRNTALGRRVADLFRAFVAALGNPVDTVTLSNVLAAVERGDKAGERRKKGDNLCCCHIFALCSATIAARTAWVGDLIAP
jgi:hypothetical protein